jgi:hypothetical protein
VREYVGEWALTMAKILINELPKDRVLPNMAKFIIIEDKEIQKYAFKLDWRWMIK